MAYEKIDSVSGLWRNNETGVYYVRRFLTGKPPLFKSTGETRLVEAKRVAVKLVEEWLGSDGASERKIYYWEVADELLEIMQTKAEKTYEEFEGFDRLHLRPYFGAIPIDEVGGHWELYKAKCRLKNAKRSLRYDRKVLVRVLRYALEKHPKIMKGLPVLKIDEMDKYVPSGRETTIEERRKINALAKGDESLKLEIKDASGMRDVEIRKLRYEYIDFENGYITLPKEIIKTRRERTLAISREVLDKLAARREQKRLLAEKKGRPVSPYVFPHRLDPMRPQTRSDKGWQRLKRAAGVKIKRHWKRYDFVSDGLRGGAAPKVLQKSVGMSDPVMNRVYHQVNRKDARRVLEAVARGRAEAEEAPPDKGTPESEQDGSGDL